MTRYRKDFVDRARAEGLPLFTIEYNQKYVPNEKRSSRVEGILGSDPQVIKILKDMLAYAESCSE